MIRIALICQIQIKTGTNEESNACTARVRVDFNVFCNLENQKLKVVLKYSIYTRDIVFTVCAPLHSTSTTILHMSVDPIIFVIWFVVDHSAKVNLFVIFLFFFLIHRLGLAVFKLNAETLRRCHFTWIIIIICNNNRNSRDKCQFSFTTFNIHNVTFSTFVDALVDKY